MDISGKIVQINAPITGEGKNGPWKKQEFILEIPGKFTRKVCLVAWGDTVKIDDLKVGDSVKAHIDIESREYNGRWFTDVKAWRVDMEGASEGGPNEMADRPAPDNVSDIPPERAEDDDLPF